MKRMIMNFMAGRANRHRLNKEKEKDEELRKTVNVREYKGHLFITVGGLRIADVTSLPACEICERVAEMRRTLRFK